MAVTKKLELQDLRDNDLPESLALISEDVAAHPQRLKAIDPALVGQMRELTAGVEIDLDAPLSPQDE